VVDANGINISHVTSALLPNANITYDLGSTSQRWKDIWLANSTIHIGNGTISSDDANSQLVLSNAITTKTITLTGNGTTISGNVSFANSTTIIANAFTSNNYVLGNANTTISVNKWVGASTTSTTPDQILYEANATNVTSIDFHVTATDGTNSRQVAKILAVNLGTQTNYIEYGGMWVGPQIADIIADQSGGNIRLLSTPLTANTIQYNIVLTTYN
jgi:hypothetical protein